METTGLGAYLRTQREWRGWSGAELAGRAGLTPSHYSQIERGKIAWPSAANRRALAEALGLRHIDLLIAAGELTAEEAFGPTGIKEDSPDYTIFPAQSPAARTMEILRLLPDDDARIVLGMADFLDRRNRGEIDREEPPAVRVGTKRSAG